MGSPLTCALASYPGILGNARSMSIRSRCIAWACSRPQARCCFKNLIAQASRIHVLGLYDSCLKCGGRIDLVCPCEEWFLTHCFLSRPSSIPEGRRVEESRIRDSKVRTEELIINHNGNRKTVPSCGLSLATTSRSYRHHLLGLNRSFAARSDIKIIETKQTHAS
jgi:hypothetical protein